LAGIIVCEFVSYIHLRHKKQKRCTTITVQNGITPAKLRNLKRSIHAMVEGKEEEDAMMV
jgi:hypothetical protein